MYVCVFWKWGVGGVVRPVIGKHVTAMYDTAWSDCFQEILFDVNIIHVNSAR